MAGSSARASKCTICGKEACKGDCKKCPKRMAGECAELYIPISKQEGGNTVYGWACTDCWRKRHAR